MATHNFGVSALGGGRYPKLLRDYPAGFGTCVFTSVSGFADGMEAVKEAVRSKKPFIVTDLCWDDNHVYGKKDYAHVEKECKRLLPIIKANPQIKWYVKPVTEHRLKQADWEPFAAIVNRVLKGLKYEIVNSPDFKAGFVHPKYVNEYHGKELKPRKGGRFAFHADGSNAFDIDIEALKAAYAGAEYFIFWCPQVNGNRKMFKLPERPHPRPDRKHWVTKELALALRYLANDRGLVSIPAGWIYKSNADQQEAPNKRDCKPCWITPLGTKPKVIEFRTTAGQVISRAPYADTFNEKNKDGSKGKVIGYRYYHEDALGFRLSEKARKLSGSPVCFVFADGKRVGEVNPAFRAGPFRND